MIRNQKIIDKLVADLHFHNYLSVDVGDHFFTDRSEYLDNLQKHIDSLRLPKKLDAHTDFYHGGQVVAESVIEHIYDYLDDIFLDLFFRTYPFKQIIFPESLCCQRITQDGKISREGDIIINLNNIYDRCTFAYNIWRLFGVKGTLLAKYPSNKFVINFYYRDQSFGSLGYCTVLVNDIPYDKELDEYIIQRHAGKAIKSSQFRADEIFSYLDFLKYDEGSSLYSGMDSSYKVSVYEFMSDYRQIKDEHVFGEYTIEDILFLYSLLTNKFLLSENAFLLCLCSCKCNCSRGAESTILNAFHQFEKSNKDVSLIKPLICQEDLYLRFTNRENSKAFTFHEYNDCIETIQRFKKHPVFSVMCGNTLPLPYLYNKLNLV